MRIMMNGGWRGWNTHDLDPDDDWGFLAYPLGPDTLHVTTNLRDPDPRFPDDWRNNDKLTERTLNDEESLNGYAWYTCGEALMYYPLRVGLPELSGECCETLYKEIKRYHAALL